MRTTRLIPLAAVLGALLGAGPAHAAPCPADLAVAGLPVTGSDCQTLGDGSVRITAPRLLVSGAVNVTTATGATARMVLSADRNTMIQETPGVPLRVNVGTRPAVFGELTVGRFELCDLAPARDLPETGSIAPDVSPASTTADDIVPAEVGCRIVPSVRVSAAGIAFAAKLAGMDLDVLKSRPLILGLDEQRGGRVFGTLAIKLPAALVGDRTVRVGAGGEVSLSEGFRATTVAAQISDVFIPLPVPGAFITQAGLGIDTALERVSAQAQLMIIPIKFLITGGFALEQSRLTQLGASLAFQPAIPLTTTIKLDNFAFNFQAGVTAPGPFGPLTIPARLSGTMGFVAGPPNFGSLPGTPENLAKLLRGFVTLTVGGPQLSLKGDLFAFGTAIKLASAQMILSTAPFRFEASAKVQAYEPSDGRPRLDFLTGSMFLGIGNTGAYTAMGNVQVKVPSIVPVVGGTTLAGVQSLLSNKAAAAIVTIDPPVLAPFTGGAAFVYRDLKFELISSLTPFITVNPTAGVAAVGRAAPVRSLRLPRGLREVVVAVEGRSRRPGRVRFTPPRGRARVVRLPFGDGRTAYYGMRAPVAGRWRVSSRTAIARIRVSRIGATPYLDPRPGWGTRPRGPVTAGASVPVCWQVKNAPRGAVVDILEDMNGRLATGRTLAEGLPARGCHQFSTAGLEPGRHWVYGVLRRGDVPISARYWPIGIEVVDPQRLPAPAGVAAGPTADGARVTFAAQPAAAGYAITARPVGEDVPRVQAAVPVAEAPSAELSLRGAAEWDVTVQAMDLQGAIGNASAPVRVRPLSPVVASGEPNGAAQVGKRWAFQLRLSPDTRVRLLSGPPGLTVTPAGLARWTPSARAGRQPPQDVRLQACRDDRCLEREFSLSAYPAGTAPAGPARGFEATPNVVRRRGGVLTIYAQGIDERAVVRVDGRRVRVLRKLNASAIEVRLPRLRRGPHDISLKIGGDLEETRRGAVVVL